MGLKLAKFRLLLRSVQELHLPPYLGSTLRGGFGHAFRQIVCIQKGTECADCLLRERCIFVQVFDTPPPPQSRFLSKVPNAPHPFILEPPLDRKMNYEPGDLVDFYLLLIGSAIDYLPYFIFTFDQLGRIGLGKGRGKYQLEEVRAIDTQGQEYHLYTGKEKLLSGHYPVADTEDILQEAKGLPPDNSLTLSFLTPTRIKYEGQLHLRLEFHILVRNLLRRYLLLSYFHGQGEPGLDFKGMIEEAKKVTVEASGLYWADWERFSARHNTRMKLGGFKGPITFQGPLAGFLPLLNLGTFIHVGKGSSFGLGRYLINK